MALIVSGNVDMENGLSLDTSYVRTQYRVPQNSEFINISCDWYVSEETYVGGKLPINVNVQLPVKYAYDRAVDGVDVLDFTNQKIKSELESQGFSVVIQEL